MFGDDREKNVYTVSLTTTTRLSLRSDTTISLLVPNYSGRIEF